MDASVDGGDGWLNGWMEGWMDGDGDGRLDGGVSRCVAWVGCVSGGIDGMDGWKDGLNRREGRSIGGVLDGMSG